jgi:hypothetical protein
MRGVAVALAAARGAHEPRALIRRKCDAAGRARLFVGQKWYRRPNGGSIPMKLYGWVAALVLVGASVPLAIAQSDLDTPSSDQYVARLGAIMNAVQTGHIKLWFAAKAQNWDLARFELRQLKAGLSEAAVHYSGIPVSNITTLGTPLQSVGDAIEAKDGKRFVASFGDLTNGCNACHDALARGFIVIRTPTEQPFGNQVFAPPVKR